MRRKIKRNHRSGIPQNHVVFDCETTPEPHPDNPGQTLHRLHLVIAKSFRYVDGLLTRESELVAYDRSTFWAWLMALCGPRKVVWAWAHNLAFDLTALRVWELIETGQLHFGATPKPGPIGSNQQTIGRKWRGILVSGDPPTIMSVRTKEGAALKCVDTMNWLPVGLAQIAGMMGMSKGIMPGENGTDDDWKQYCANDVAILRKAVWSILDYVRVNDLGNLRTTVSSQAYALWRHRCMDCRVDTHDDLGVKRVERSAYYGCRRGNYFIGEVIHAGMSDLREFYGVSQVAPLICAGPVHRLDVTAAYPSVMLDGPFPTALARSPATMTVARLRGLMGAYCAVAVVLMHSPREPWPVRVKSSTHWMVGHLRTVLCGPELLRALDSGYVTDVERAYLYTSDRPFNSFVYETWRLRHLADVAGDDFGKTLAKAMAVALHGKFGQRSFRWSKVDGRGAPILWGTFHRRDKETGDILTYRSLGGHPQLQGDRGEIEGSSPILAAYVLAYHRERVRAARLVAGDREVLYEDADSIHVTQRGKDALEKAGAIKPGVMGAWRVVTTAQRATYWGHKHYRLDDVIVRPGLSGRAVRDKEGMWHQTDFQRLDSILGGVPPEGPVCYDRCQADPEGSVDGCVGYDGWVVPLERRV